MQTQTGNPSRPSRSADTIARGLGWFSIGLGVAELLMARCLGTRDLFRILLECFLKILPQPAVTTASEEASCVPRTYPVERLTYGLHQRLFRAGSDGSQQSLNLRECLF